LRFSGAPATDPGRPDGGHNDDPELLKPIGIARRSFYGRHPCHTQCKLAIGPEHFLDFRSTSVGRTLENDGMSGGPKTAVSALMRQAAREVGAWNVRLNGVAPGVIDAGIVHASFEVDDVAKGVITSCLNQTPLGRMGAPEDVAALADFLVSNDASYISGQVIAVDGGYSA